MDPTNLTIAIVGLVLSTLTIAAILYGPIAALKIQRKLDQESEERKRDRERKQFIFRTLWVTRSTPINPRHVEALNMIDLDYPDCKPVVDAWNLYLDHLNSDSSRPNWEAQRVDSLTELLYQMSLALGYSYDRVLLKRHWYRPLLHWQIDDMDMALRKGFAEIIKGEQAFPVKIVDVQQAQPAKADMEARQGEKRELPRLAQEP
ncbi:MAG TPA: DUF6680 family protein [Candidatus Acidoferrales bacterium]|nr:DUF6680 family protein [Candidatus Acidoferrales bacterium]